LAEHVTHGGEERWILCFSEELWNNENACKNWT
jgi:hypothetical protein